MTRQPNIKKLPFRHRKQKLPIDKPFPEQPGAPPLKVKLGNRIIFFFTGSRKTIGEVVVATGTVIGGFWGFLLRIAGTLIAGVKTVKAKAIEKVKGKSLLEILKSIWEFLKKLFR